MAQSTVPTWEGMELEEDKDLRFEMKLILTLWFDGLDEYIKGRLTKALMEYRLVKQLAAEATAAPQTGGGQKRCWSSRGPCEIQPAPEGRGWRKPTRQSTLRTDFFCSLTVCHLVSQKCTIFFTFCCFVLLRVYFGFENCLLLNPCFASLDYKN